MLGISFETDTGLKDWSGTDVEWQDMTRVFWHKKDTAWPEAHHHHNKYLTLLNYSCLLRGILHQIHVFFEDKLVSVCVCVYTSISPSLQLKKDICFQLLNRIIQEIIEVLC